jgi:hypothetical protein
MVAVTLQGADAGGATTIIETAIAAAEQIEDAQAGVTEPQTSPTRGIIAITPWLISTPSASASALQSPTGVAAIGHRRSRPRHRCMGIVVGFVDYADGV